MSVTREQAERIASVLSEGLPYIQKFYNKIIVVKYGGSVMSKHELRRGFARDIAMMKLVGMKPVIVHGGGPQIDKELKKEGIESDFISGHRVTNKKTMTVVNKVLVKVNKEIVDLIEKYGANATSLTYKNSSCILASKIKLQNTPSLGLVGDVQTIRVNQIKEVLKKDSIPVISPLGLDRRGICLNINADVVAGRVAEFLKAEKLILLTDVAGIVDNTGSLISKITTKKAQKFLMNDIVKGGMKPKLSSALKAISKGVKSVQIIDGRLPHAVLLEVLTVEGVGTLISPK